MKKILIALLLSASLTTGAAAQVGKLQAGQVFGNPAGAAAPGKGANVDTNLWMGTGSGCAAIAQNSTVFIGPTGCSSATEVNFQFPVSSPITVKSLFVKASTAPVSAQTYTITLRKNGVDTALTCAMTAAATTCNDTNAAHAVAFAQGDLITMKLVTSATAASLAALNTSATVIEALE